MPPFPDLPSPLSDGAVAVRFATERDIPEVLIAHQDDPGLAAALGLTRPPSGAELGRRAEVSSRERALGDGVWLTIVRDGKDTCIGQLAVGPVDWDHARAQIAMWVAPAERGRGVGARALALAARWLIDPGELARVELFAPSSNAAMAGAARAAGFSDEGVLRGYLRRGGHRVDARVLSLIPRDLVPA